MQIQALKTLKKENSLLLVPFFTEYEKKLPQAYNSELSSLIKHGLKSKEFEGKIFETAFYTVDSKILSQKVEFLGCGEAEKFNASMAREIGATMNDMARNAKQQKLTILLTPELALYTQELVEGLVLRNYRLSKYKTGKESKDEQKKELISATLVSQKTDQTKKAIDKGLIVARAVNITRDLVNGPANVVDAIYFESLAKKLKDDYGYKLTILNKDKLAKSGWGGLLAVNKGSQKPAKCLVLKYHGGKRSDKPIVLVGKGIVFDSGGYNLKPTKHIETMNQDKAGASAVIGVFTALKELKIKQNVIGILPLTDNLIGSKAIYPSDIVTMLNGKTVEILSTDAEGRMILGDALTYGAGYFPRFMVDIATLTGAAIYALGDRYSALFANNKELRDRLKKAGDETDDVLWELPLHEDHKEKMKSRIADLRNIDMGSAHQAGSSKGAAFLSYFIQDKKGNDVAWAHIDIGGTAYTEDPRKFEQKGATGTGVRLFLKFLEEL